MGVINFGQQILTYSYGEEARARNWDKLNYQIIPAGIYSGGVLSLTGVNQVSVAPLICYIDDDNTEIGVRVETTTPVNVIVSPSQPYVILRMIWIDTSGIYMDIIPMDLADILSSDLIVGKAVYINGIIQSFFDSTLRADSLISKLVNRNNEFRVTAFDGSPTNQVEIAAGSFITNKKLVNFSGGISPTLNNTTQGRVDLIYIDDTGTIQKLEGVDAITPVTPNYHGRMVIAEIHRGPIRTDVESQDIILINFKKYAVGAMSIDTAYINWGISGLQVNASQIPIVSAIFGIQNVESALQVIASRSNRSSFVAGSAINSGKMVVQSQSGVKQFSTTPFLATAYTLPTNTTQLPFGGKNSILLNTNLIFIVYQDSTDTGKLKAVIGTINSDNSITYGNPIVLDSNTTATGSAYVYKLSSSSVIICYESWNSFRHVAMVACSISGTTITKGNTLTPTSAPGQAHDLLAFGLFDNTHAFIAYEWFTFHTVSIFNFYNYSSACNLITISGITLSSSIQTSIDTNGGTFTSDGAVTSLPPTNYKNSAIMISSLLGYFYSFPLDTYVFSSTRHYEVKSQFVTINLISGGTAISISKTLLSDLMLVDSGSYAANPQFSFLANKNYDIVWRKEVVGGGTEIVRIARFSNESNLLDSDLIVFNPLSGLNPWNGTVSIVNSDLNTLIAMRMDNSGNLTSIVFKIIGENASIIDERNFISGIANTASLCNIDKTRYLLFYGDSTNSNIVKVKVVEFLDIPSSIVGIAAQTVTTGQNCLVTYGKLLSGLSGLTIDAPVYVAADGTPTSSGTIPIPIGKATSTTQFILNVMSSVIAD